MPHPDTVTSASFPNGLPELRSEAEARAARVRPVLMKLHLGCPFCGAQPALARKVLSMYLVGCDNDDCPATPQCGGDTLAEAWSKWDSRA